MKELAGGFYSFFPRSYLCLFMFTIMHVNIPTAARSTEFHQKAKSTLKLPKKGWWSGRCWKPKRPRSISAAWWKQI